MKRITLFLFALLALLVPMHEVRNASTACTHYASPTGGGSGASTASPFLINDFWAVGSLPGKVLCLMDGTYTGANSMIRPPNNTSGTSNSRITVKAINDGKVLLDGQKVRNAVYLQGSDYFILEGFNARDGYPDAVVRLATGSDNNIVRRVIAWNVYPLNGNTSVFACNGNTGNLFEDVAWWGVARKGWECSQGVTNITVRRAWGQWQENARTGPKMTIAGAYNARQMIMENVFGTWSEVGTAVERYGIFGMDGINDGNGVAVNSKYLGGIGYIRASDNAPAWEGGIFGSRSVDYFEFKDMVIYIQPGTHTNLRPILAQKYDGGGSTPVAGNPATVPLGNRKLTNVTTIGGGTSFIDATWTKTNVVQASTVAGAPSIWKNGLCYRYNNGVVTDEPLWPFPLDANNRLRDARKLAGKNPDSDFGVGKTFTDLMESLFGAIPSECRSSGAPPAPSTPGTYYVGLGVGDSDSNSCTSAKNNVAGQRRRTITAGIACLTAGSTLKIKAGTYTSFIDDSVPIPGGSSSAPTIIEADGADVVTIQPTTGGRLGDVILLGSGQSNIIFRNLVIDGANVSNAGIHLISTASSVQFDNLEVKNAPRHGIYFEGASNNNNFVYRTAVHDIGTTSEHHGIYIHSSGNTIDTVTTRNISGYGVHVYFVGSSPSNNLIKNTRTHNNTRGGILIAHGANNRIMNTLIYGNGIGMRVGFSATGTLIYNNTFYGNTDGLSLDAGTANAIARNNIFWTNSGDDIVNNSTNFTQSNNLCSSGCAVSSDPLFLNAGGGDFRLGSGSPAANQGTSLSSIFAIDFGGIARPQGVAWDIGAYEFSGAGSSFFGRYRRR